MSSGGKRKGAGRPKAAPTKKRNILGPDNNLTLTIMDTIAIHASKNSETVIKSINASVNALSSYCSKTYANRILSALEKGSLYGVYFTKSGKLRASFI